MATAEPNYFTCTLGQAAERRLKQKDGPFKTVLDLVDEQARLIPDLPALGFADFLSQTGHAGVHLDTEIEPVTLKDS